MALGSTEYRGRYVGVMRSLAEVGFVVFGCDHLGHGLTAEDDSELGFIAHKGGHALLAEDVFAIYQVVAKRFPNKKYILFGHSMGSFVVRLTAEKYGDAMSGLIVCGTGGPNPMAPAGLVAADLVRLFKGERHTSLLLEYLAFSTYNSRYGDMGGTGWLTKDTAITEKYGQDKFCNFHFSASAMHDLVKLNASCNRAAWFKNMRKDLPVFLIAGDGDPVGDYGKGVTKVYDKLKKQGVDVRMKLYKDCRHEILNDTCRQETIEDILTFVKEVLLKK